MTNTGAVEHNLAVKGTDLKTSMLKAGESATPDVGHLKQGDDTLRCEVAGHESA